MTPDPATTPTPTPDPDRYARQLQVPGVGDTGQARLAAARVLLVGAGGLGSPAGLYLAGAGVGTIGIVDDDRVERSNLHRQIIHRTEDEGRLKVDSGARALRELNPEVDVRTHPIRLTRDTVLDVVADYDIVVDGADSFTTRALVSDACTLLDIPHVWAAVLTDGGQLSVFHASKGPVYRDLLPELPPAGSVPSCAVAGVLGTVPGVLGTAMAGEVLKLILGIGEPAIGRVLVYDMLTAEWQSVPLARSPRTHRPTAPAEVGADLPRQMSIRDLDPARVAAGGGLIVDVRTPAEAAAGMIPGAHLLPLAAIEVDPRGALARVREWAADDAAADVYLHCRSGARSVRAQELLETALGEAAAQDGAPLDGESGAARETASGADLRFIDLAGGYVAWVRETGPEAGSEAGRESDPR